MYKLRRMHLDTIGVPDNRFADLTIDALDADGSPTDTLVWMRNGSGKTTIMSLLAAHILPARRDFLAARKGRRRNTVSRTLEDLVQSEDTAHVVAEWEAPDGSLLLTGAVWEWTNKRRPIDYNGANAAKLKHLFWAMRPDPLQGATFEVLPLTHRTRGQTDLAGFHAWINRIAGAGVDAVAVTGVDSWHRVLDDRGFDAELYRYFVEINSTEGGIDALFADIRTDNDFARYLLGFVADAPRAASVRDLLREVATELARRPGYRTEQEFCVAAAPLLADLAEQHERVATAAATRDAAARAAAAFGAGLRDAARHADDQAERAGADHVEVEERRRTTRQQTDAARRRRDEFLRLAANLWLTDADREQGAAEDAQTTARIHSRAWEAVEKLVVLRRREADVAAHRRAMQARQTRAEPLLHQADQAAADLVAALAAAADEADEQVRVLDEELGVLDAAERAAHEDVVAAERLDAELDTEEGQLRQTTADLESKRDRALADGLLAAGVAVEQALADEEARLAGVAADIVACDESLLDAGRAVEQAARVLTQTRTARAAAELDAARAEATLTALRRRAGPLEASELAASLAQTSDLDLLVEARRIAGLSAQAGATADARLLERGVDASTQRFAVLGLAEDHLLPPRPAVRHVLTALLAAEVTAVTGWSYVAENLPPAAAVEAIRALPEVCDGVVVYGDPVVAAAAIAGLDVDDPVVLAPVDVFAEPSGAVERWTVAGPSGGVERWTVVGPSAARYDRAAGAAELTVRRDRLAAHDQETAAVRATRDAHHQLTSDLRGLADEVDSHGGAASVRDAAARTDTTRRETRAAETAAELASRDAEQHVVTVTARRSDLAVAQSRIQGRVTRLTELVADLAGWEQATRRLAAVPDLRRQAAERRDRAGRRVDEARAQRNDVHTARTRTDDQARRWRTDQAAIPVPAGWTGGVPVGGLTVARQLYEQARRLAAEAFDEPELRRRLDDLIEATRAAGQEWGSYEPAVREEAKRCAARPDAADPFLLARRREGAEAELLVATERVSRARIDRAAADRAVHDRRPAGRLRYADLTVEPATRAEAEELAGEEEATAVELQDVVSGLETRLARLEKQQQTARARSRELGLLANRFADWPDAAGIEPTPIPTEQAALDGISDRTFQAARTAESGLNTALARRAQSFESLRTWAGQDRFARTADESQMIQRLRTLFREQPATMVADRAGALGGDLVERQARIAEHLTHLEQSQRNVVTRLVELVDDALADLARFSRLSELPAGIGPWQHREFVRIQPRSARPTDEQLQVRVSDLVDRLVEPGRSLAMEPLDLVWQATEAAVAPAGFRASILKPDPAQPTHRVDVTDMNKWSGGENLTACLVLFCVMVKLRAENRGKRAGSAVAGGLVPLDNPLGKANYVPFLQLQRTVAAASGVQLLFFTGIGDLPAVRAFGSIVACSKRRGRTAQGAYVTLDATVGAPSGREAGHEPGREIEHIRLVRRTEA